MSDYVKDLAEAREAAEFFEGEARRLNNLAAASRRLCTRMIESAALEDSLTQKVQRDAFLDETIKAKEARIEQLDFQARIQEGREHEQERNQEFIGNMLNTGLTRVIR